MARRQQLTLASNAGAGAQTGVDWQGGAGMFMAEATWGGGNVRLEIQTPNGTWVGVPAFASITAISLTANGAVTFQAPAGKLRANITTSSAVHAYVVGIPSNAAG
jgi:hypothetical protein